MGTSTERERARLIFVKPSGDRCGTLLSGISISGTHVNRIYATSKWRRAVVGVLLVVAAFAPVAGAACAFEHLAGHIGSQDPVSATAEVAIAWSYEPTPSPCDDESCCGLEPDLFLAQAKAPTPDASFGLWTPGADMARWGRHAPAVRAAVSGPVSRRRTPAPVEPVFRRVPRLLI
jgi:hypothetical protein